MGEHDATDADFTVGELTALLDRHRKALAEAGRPDLAEHAHVRVSPDGSLSIGYTPPRHKGTAAPEALKAVDIDPVFERAEV
jgi:hypothetical protein